MKVQFSDIELGQYEVIKERYVKYGEQDHSRTVLHELDTDLYYKLWKPEYVRSKNMLDAYNAGFYDKLSPAFVSIIMDGDDCVGYIMKTTIPNILTETSDFFELLLEETKRTGWFYYDWIPDHLMQYDSNPTLIDLESVYPISELENVLNNKYNCKFRNPEYKEFVWNLYQSTKNTLEA